MCIRDRLLAVSQNDASVNVTVGFPFSTYMLYRDSAREIIGEQQTVSYEMCIRDSAYPAYYPGTGRFLPRTEADQYSDGFTIPDECDQETLYLLPDFRCV